MRQRFNNSGFGIIEVVVSLSLVAILVVSLGSVLSAVYKLYTAGGYKVQALALAQEPLEILNDIKNEEFACSCGGTCSTCTASDGQTCAVTAPYTSCWTALPRGITTAGNYFLDDTAGSWSLEPLVGGVPETITSDPRFSREILVENLTRNADGDIDPAGTAVDISTKKISVKVYWMEKGSQKSVILSTILTAWENL